MKTMTRVCSSCGASAPSWVVHSCPFCGRVMSAKTGRSRSDLRDVDDVEADNGDVTDEELVKAIPQLSREDWETVGRTYT